MAFPVGTWILDQTHPVLTLTTAVKGRPFTLRAPIDSADVTVAQDITLTLGVGIDHVSAGNFLLDAALRGFLVNYGAHELFFAGTGVLDADPVELGGVAKAGQVSVDLTLELREVSRTQQSLVIDITGTAVFKDVDIPIPGIGSLDQLSLDVKAQLDLVPSQ